jgi:hypothetical protein
MGFCGVKKHSFAMLKIPGSLLIGIFIVVLFSSYSYSQQKVVYGIVADDLSRKPVSFANISIKNAAAGTTTDAAGRFKINITKEKQTVIIVSHINYHKKEIVVNDSLFSGNVTIYL